MKTGATTVAEAAARAFRQLSRRLMRLLHRLDAHGRFPPLEELVAMMPPGYRRALLEDMATEEPDRAARARARTRTGKGRGRR